jgi:hypothetical protein
MILSVGLQAASCGIGTQVSSRTRMLVQAGPVKIWACLNKHACFISGMLLVSAAQHPLVHACVIRARVNDEALNMAGVVACLHHIAPVNAYQLIQ